MKFKDKYTSMRITKKFALWLKKQQISRTTVLCTPSYEDILIDILGIRQELD